jgi:hypothetical protein
LIATGSSALFQLPISAPQLVFEFIFVYVHIDHNTKTRLKTPSGRSF